MKNCTIFLLVLLAIAAAGIAALRDNTRTATVEGIFSDRLYIIGHPRAYLRNAADDSILDSCVISDNRFRLTCDIALKELLCRITLTGRDSVSEILLHPQQHVQLHIGPDPARKTMAGSRRGGHRPTRFGEPDPSRQPPLRQPPEMTQGVLLTDNALHRCLRTIYSAIPASFPPSVSRSAFRLQRPVFRPVSPPRQPIYRPLSALRF